MSTYSYDALRAAVAVVRDPDIGWIEYGPAAQALAGFVSDYLDYCDEIDPPQEEDQ